MTMHNPGIVSSGLPVVVSGTVSIQPLSGAGAAGTRDLTLADTWYAVPSTVPASDYVLVVSKESVAGTIRWSFSNGSSPSITFGNRLSTNDLIVELEANEFIYVSSTSGGDDVNWTTKVI